MYVKVSAIVISLCMILWLAAFSQKDKEEEPDLPLSAAGAILMEQESGRVLYDHNADTPARIASITKIMTAILAIESGKLDETVTASRTAVMTEGSSIYLKIGEKMKLEDLLYGLMLRSGNDAANAIAEHVGGSVEGFVFLMNQKAQEIGMHHTVFSNPTGLDDHENHYSTPYDMALLMRYAMNNDMFKEISGTKAYTVEREDGKIRWKNKNRLLTEKYQYTTGGKTGFTKKAGRTLVTTASKNGMNLIAVTLNAPDDWNDHISLYEYGFEHFQIKQLLSKGELFDIAELPDDKQLYVKHHVNYPLKEKEVDYITIKYHILSPEDLGKMKEGQAGEAVFYFQNDVVRTIPIYLKELDHGGRKSWWDVFKNLFFTQTGVKIND
ncbi:D-alanyl-D-alanine carboxypeptidase family protein [Siminovitchia sp. 179-K 8D1 HS]|uniref:D-alanyl-D-alanine carboxypeptidase family protein n=1 Tax=Siminovitchia sp. 179-K 8D1 HS TaxID=3142385 RepID=UPI0039A36F50